MDVVATYESYCSFIDMIADDDILESIGMEAAVGTAEEKKETANKVRTTKKKYGLISAINALIDGIVDFFTKLLGIEKEENIEKVVMYAAPEAPSLSISQIENELIRKANLLVKVDRNSDEFKKLKADCENLLNDFRKKSDEVASAAKKYREMYDDRPFNDLPFSKSMKKYEANIGMTKKQLKRLMKATDKSNHANKEVISYVQQYLNIVQAIANHTKVNKPNKHKAWTDEKAKQALTKPAEKVERSLGKARQKAVKYEKITNGD